MNYNIDIDSTIGYPYSSNYVKSLLSGYKGKPCTVRINSLGGNVRDALDIRQQFIDHGDITACVVGMTASAATIIAMGAKKVCMSKHALLLIHPSSTYICEWGQMNKEELDALIRDLERSTDTLGKVDDVLTDIYAKKCKKPKCEVKAVLEASRWLTADECLRFGLVDEIFDGEDIPLSDKIKNEIQACGFCIPTDNNALIHKAKDILNKTNTTTNMKKKLELPLISALLSLGVIEAEDDKTSLTSEQLASIEKDIKSKTETITSLTSEKETLANEVEKLKAEKEALSKTNKELQEQVTALNDGDGDTSQQASDKTDESASYQQAVEMAGFLSELV